MPFHAEYIERGSRNRLIAFSSSSGITKTNTKHWGKARLH